MKQPLVAPLAALAAGIWAARFATFTLPETLLSVSVLAALAAVAVRLRAFGAGMAACLVGFSLAGALLASLPRPGDARYDPNLITKVLDREQADFADPIRLRGWVREPPENLGDSDRFVVETNSVFRGTAVRGAVRITVRRVAGAPALQLAYGQRVEFLARLRLLRNFQNPGSFDYVGYQNRRGIFASGTVRAGVPIFVLEGLGGSRAGSLTWAARLWARARFSAIATCCTGGDEQAAAILRAMLLGERDLLDPQTTTDFQRVGVYHVLVISGLHVGLLAFVLLRLLYLLPVPRAISAMFAIVLVAAYAVLVGAGTPVLRAAWMIAAYLTATLVYRQRRALNIIAATALLFLVADPDLLFDAGFQLSFLAVALIAAIAVPFLETTLDPLRLALSDIWNTDRDLHAESVVAAHRVAIRIWLEPLAALSGLPRAWVGYSAIGLMRLLVWAAELVVVSLVVQAGLALPLAFHFQRVSWTGVSANLWIVPLLFVAVPLGLAALLTGWAPLAKVAFWAAGAMGRVVEAHAHLLPSDMRVPPPPLWLSICFGLSLAAIALSFEASRRTRCAAVGACLALLSLVVWHPFPPQLQPGRLEMAAIDVGQGDSLFVAFPEGQTMIVDGGGLPDFRDSSDPATLRKSLDIGELVVSPYLWSRSVKKLNVVAVTHADGDHLGGIAALLRNFEVGELWLGGGTFEAEYREIAELARGRGVPIRHVVGGQVRLLGGAKIEILGPSSPAPSVRNDRSLVLCLRYGEQSFLLTGDIERNGESTLAASEKLSPRGILKVAHHGSRSSTQSAFLQRARPAFAVVSAGYDNLYGHPHPAVIERLKQAHAAVLRTDEEGLISVSTDGRRIFVDTFRRRNLGSIPRGELNVAAGDPGLNRRERAQDSRAGTSN